MIIRTATADDVEGMMALDYRYYPEEWRVPVEDVRRTFQKGSHLARVIDTPDGIKGYYAHIPLTHEAFEYVLRGELNESGMADHVLDYRSHIKEVYLYSVSIIVDIEDPLRKVYSTALIQDMPSFLNAIRQKGIEVKELGAIVISEAGQRVAQSIGYRHYGQVVNHEGQQYPIFRARLEDIMKAIKAR